MKALRGFLDKIGAPFHKGGRFEKLYPLYEAADTFLFTPSDRAKGLTHVRDAIDLKRMMITVVWALTPCVLMAMYNTGYQAFLAMEAAGMTPGDGAQWQWDLYSGMFGMAADSGSIFGCFLYGALFFLPVYIVCMTAGGIAEAIFSTIRGHEINEGFLVTGMLFPLTLPPTIPLWQVAVGIVFGVVIGKEVFGGTGKNFMNPALTARAFLYFAYPAQITGNSSIWNAAGDIAMQGGDGYTGATILGAVAEGGMEKVESLGFTMWDSFLGLIPGSMGETSVLACILGAGFLIATGVGNWRIMASVTIFSLLFGAVLFGIGGDAATFTMNPIWHLLAGGLAFGLVFMATDPVSASMTRTGMWWYGAVIALMTLLVRVINPAFPEGIMLAILFGNVFAPLIDYYVVRGNVKRRMLRSVQ